MLTVMLQKIDHVLPVVFPLRFLLTSLEKNPDDINNSVCIKTLLVHFDKVSGATVYFLVLLDGDKYK